MSFPPDHFWDFMEDGDFTKFAKREGQMDELKEIANRLLWRPIETAPKDSFVLLYCMEDNSRWLGKWQGHRWYGVDDMGLTREGHSLGDPDVVTGWAVTAWMPLPEPPFTGSL